MRTTNNIYGVLSNGAHVDVSRTLHGAKCYATRNGILMITVRYNCGYIANVDSLKLNGKWVKFRDVAPQPKR